MQAAFFDFTSLLPVHVPPGLERSKVQFTRQYGLCLEFGVGPHKYCAFHTLLGTFVVKLLRYQQFPPGFLRTITGFFCHFGALLANSAPLLANSLTLLASLRYRFSPATCGQSGFPHRFHANGLKTVDVQNACRKGTVRQIEQGRSKSLFLNINISTLQRRHFQSVHSIGY